jgi:hypothetical protein
MMLEVTAEQRDMLEEMLGSRLNACAVVAARFAAGAFVWNDDEAACRERWEREERVCRELLAQLSG